MDNSHIMPPPISVPKLANVGDCVSQLLSYQAMLNTKSLDLKSILTSDFKLKPYSRYFKRNKPTVALAAR